MRNRCILLAASLLIGCGQPPAPPPPPPAPLEPAPTITPRDELLGIAREAVRRRDFHSLDTLRNSERPIEEILEPMIQDYHKETDWPGRDAIVFLFEDIRDDRLIPIMRHALDSPNLETRAIAVTSLSGDRNTYETLLGADGKPDEKKVNAAVDAARKPK